MTDPFSRSHAWRVYHKLVRPLVEGGCGFQAGDVRAVREFLAWMLRRQIEIFERPQWAM